MSQSDDSDDDAFSLLAGPTAALGLADATDDDDIELSHGEVYALEHFLVQGNEYPTLPKSRLAHWIPWWHAGEYWRIALDAPSHIVGHFDAFESRQVRDGYLSQHLQLVRSRCERSLLRNTLSKPQMLMLGAACLHTYAIANYTGPSSALPLDALRQKFTALTRDALEVCGESASRFCSLPGTLVLARASLLCDVASSHWGMRWKRRACVMHARALSRGVRRELWDSELASCADDNDATAGTLLELGMCEHYFDRDLRGKRRFSQAAKNAKLEVAITGALGKRTQFQQRSVPQLKLVVSKEWCPAPQSSQPQRQQQPQSVPLHEDSVLLEQGVAYDDEGSTSASHHHNSLFGNALEQAIVLALCLDVKNSNPEDGLTKEEMRPYVQAVLAEPLNWMTGSAALLQRCRLEAESKYSADRAAMQLQVLVEQHATALENDASAKSRLEYIYGLDYPAIWEAKEELARAMVSLGAALTAAELFVELEQWDAVVECYAAAGRRHEALEIIKSKPATPSLLCAEGDLTDDASAYERAWHLSNARCYRAARTLGKRFAVREPRNWSEAAHWHCAATTIAPHSAAAWFDLGIARVMLDNLEAATAAFSRAAACAPDDADSWANLASCHLKLGEVKRAAAALERAVSLRPEDFRLWENYSRVAARLRNSQQLLRGLHRLLDLRAQSRRPVASLLDQLAIAAHLVESNPDDTFAAKSLDELFRRIDKTPFSPNDPQAPEMWRIRAETASKPAERRAARFKQARALFNHPHVWRQAELKESLLQAATQLAEECEPCTSSNEEEHAALLSDRNAAAHFLHAIAARLEPTNDAAAKSRLEIQVDALRLTHL